jgi:hypothetical protein
LSPKFGILINPFISISQKFGLLHQGRSVNRLMEAKAGWKKKEEEKG